MRPKLDINCRSIICLALLTAFLAAPGAAQAPPSDVALVTMLSGEVSYWNDAEKKAPARMQAFMKVRQGDHLKLPGATSLTLLYFASGRQETWRGPVTLRAADTESTAVGAEKSPPLPEVKLIPAKATKQIQGAPLPLPGPSISKSGVIQTMGPKCEPAAGTPAPLSAEARRNIKEAEKVFQELKKTAAADDVTPELYFLSILNEYKQFPEMAKVVDTMLQKRPGDVALKDLKVWVRSQSAARD
jgi:hypothetical protein